MKFATLRRSARAANFAAAFVCGSSRSDMVAVLSFGPFGIAYATQ